MGAEDVPGLVAVAEPRHATREFRALGSSCRIDVWCGSEGPEPSTLLESAKELIDDLERRWTRFHPGSELSRLNRHAGVPVPVSGPTIELVSTAVTAWQHTDGRFDPTVGEAINAAGYNRTFDDLVDPTPTTTRHRPWVPGCAEITVDRAAGTITLPAGTTLDLGGIGKGRAADLVAGQLMAFGAVGACVDLGGDLRVVGRAPASDRWVITIDDPDAPGNALAAVAIADTGGTGGAVATSSTTRRRWQGPDGPAHHLIDPSTGRPSTSGVVSATVVAAEATWAEILAKAAVIAGPESGSALIDANGLAGLLVVRTSAGRELRRVGDMAHYLTDVDAHRGVPT